MPAVYIVSESYVYRLHSSTYIYTQYIVYLSISSSIRFQVFIKFRWNMQYVCWYYILIFQSTKVLIYMQKRS